MTKGLQNWAALWTAIVLAVWTGALQAGEPSGAFPYTVTPETRSRPLSAAMRRGFERYPAPRSEENELYSQFRYTPLKGLDYHGGAGTVSRRDPTKVLFENGKYHVWFTRRQTVSPPRGPQECSDRVPSTDWDLAEIWHATSKDGFTWVEEGVAVPRPPKPLPGWRSVSTPGILKFKGKFYLYYQSFLEPSGTRGDYCPVSASWADSPDGPWHPTGKLIIPNGKAGEWDQYAVHDPYPLVHDGKIYIYYKSVFNRPGTTWIAHGVAIADDPLGPFVKHPLNPVLNAGHEVTLFPFREGVAALCIRDGPEHFTMQYARDWVNFEIASITELMPVAAGPFVPDAFTDTHDGRGITWGLCHFINAAGNWRRNYSILARFDCDLSLDVHDPEMKKSYYWFRPEECFRRGLSRAQRQRIEKANRRLRGAEGSLKFQIKQP